MCFISSRLYQTFDSIMLLSHGRALYCGPGSLAPAEHFAQYGSDVVPPCPQGYNVADYLLEVASDPPVALFKMSRSRTASNGSGAEHRVEDGSDHLEKSSPIPSAHHQKHSFLPFSAGGKPVYATTFLTQLQCLSGREWKILQR